MPAVLRRTPPDGDDGDGHYFVSLWSLMLVAARAVLLPLDALGVQALVLRGEVVAILTLAAGENDLVAWH